ncbi:carbohydrate-binding module family 12 protein [Podospora fimiseda]|uniref:Carbohydrate-binding module family 12 protein n=1 Tax=Podospora fimiseda TaxID=252190 RepID=A0AAN7BGE6_9PEZI|nr:carbohydrate-binding module family 12 protein [Podospora fimiseda]
MATITGSIEISSLNITDLPSPDWSPKATYKVGDRVTFNGKVYECIQAHTSQSNWDPVATPALWKFIKAVDPQDPVTPQPPTTTLPALPYASELFGVYQPLIGWKSQLSHEILSKAVGVRVQRAILHANKLIKPAEPPKLWNDSGSTSDGPILRPLQTDRTGTRLGRAIAADLSFDGAPDINEFLSNITTDGLLEKVVTPESSDSFRTQGAVIAAEQDAATARVLKYLNDTHPLAVKQLFRPGVLALDRVIGGAGFFSDDHPAKNVYLSPIGLLHQFREYFFQLGTFLGPPVGHIWVSPGGSVELVEVNTRRKLIEQTAESSTTTTTKTESDRTDKDELSDAVKTENSNDMKLGASASASGGIGNVFQASATASFNLDISRKQAQEQTHKKMREQSARLSSEVQQNYKTTFRTVTELTDTSSRRYVLQNQTDKLVSYELSRKMRKVAVQVQDLGQRLCWQAYVENPGDPLGTGEFVHSTAAALDPSLKPPEEQPYPDPQIKIVSDAFPYILRTGDKELEEDFTPDPDHSGWGMHENGIFEANDRIDFIRKYKLPPGPAGFKLNRIKLLDFHGAAVKWLDDLKLNPATEEFTLQLTYANFGNRDPIPFDAVVEYLPDDETLARINKKNAENKQVYSDAIAAEREKNFYETLRQRLKLLGQVTTRSQDDMRAEERSVIYRSLISRLYGTEEGWKSDDYYAASEMIRYFFDVDAMLYFVAPDWWKPRQAQLTSVDSGGHLTSAAMTQEPLSTRAGLMGKTVTKTSGGSRPHYLVTEETEPAKLGSSLGWLMQLDGDNHRNAFLNSPWVKAVLPIRPGREKEAIVFLQRQEVAGSEGLDTPYPYDSNMDPIEYKGKSIKEVLMMVAEKIGEEYRESLKPKPVGLDKKEMALPTEMVFAHGFDPLEGGIKFDDGAFKIFSQWMEVLPTDQIVATEYSTKGL